METTILTIETVNQTGIYYFDLNTNSNRIKVSWHEKQLRVFNNLSEAFVWFINNHSDYSVKNIDENYVK
jgi:hypothetical protein